MSSENAVGRRPFLRREEPPQSEADFGEDTPTQPRLEAPDTDVGERAEELMTVRLRQADALVREGARALDDGVRVTLYQGDGGLVTLDAPLPPAPLELALGLQLPATTSDEGEGAHFVRAVRRQLETHLAGPVEAREATGEVSFRWRPRGYERQLDALPRLRAMGELVARSLARLDAEGPSASAVDRLDRRFAEAEVRPVRLSVAFADATRQLVAEVGPVHRLAAAGPPSSADQAAFALVQTEADLYSPRLGAGLYLALRLPGEAAQRSALAERLVAVVRRKFELSLLESPDLEVLDEWDGMEESLLWSVSPRQAAGFGALLTGVAGLARFSTSLVELAVDCETALDLLGHRLAPRKGPAASQHAGAAAPAVEPAAPARPAAPEPTAPPADSTAPPDRSPAPDPTAASIATSVPPSRDSTPRRPQRPAQDKRFRIDRLEAREFIKKLAGEEPEDTDVFLSSAGFNVTKTADIVAILLSIKKEEAQALCERAPCLLTGPVTRSRANQLKQIIEGTGAKIRILDTESEDGDAEAAGPAESGGDEEEA